ncbi:MAG: hypothetical protein MI924_38275 [Chloroflexales bacterium]|nr:hypothetical protein [Chloroflexales bacterium]
MESTNDPIVQQAIRAVLDLDLDAFARDCIFGTVLSPEHAQSPWIWCWRAMAQRIRYGDYTAAFHHAQRASDLFALSDDRDGYARSVAEAAIACYHLGQYVAGLHLLAACPASTQPSIASALALARYLNAIGLNDLAAALNAAEQGSALWRTNQRHNDVCAGRLSSSVTLCPPIITAANYPWLDS